MNIELKDLNVSIKSLTYTFIMFFYETGRKYSCTRTKIGKLLSILAFKYAINGERLFNEIIYKYYDSGTAIKEIFYLLEREEYLCFFDQDNKKYISERFYNSNIPSIFFEKDMILPNKNVIVDIEDVFRNFGAYSQVDLGKLLNPIVDIAASENYGEIDLTKVKDNITKLDESNEIVKYLKQSYLNEQNKTYQKTK